MLLRSWFRVIYKQYPILLSLNGERQQDAEVRMFVCCKVEKVSVEFYMQGLQSIFMFCKDICSISECILYIPLDTAVYKQDPARC